MGKIRVRTLGDEKTEKLEKKKAQQKAEIKKIQEEHKPKPAVEEQPVSGPEITEKTKEVAKPKETKKSSPKGPKSKFAKKQKHGAKYIDNSGLIDKNKKYTIAQALEILPKLKHTKFDETVELHINTLEKGISGSIILPHGTGKELRIEIINQTEDPKHVEEVIKSIETGKINFDVLISTPDSMSKLARVARYLGPRGLMPNPKNGTISPKPQETAKKFLGGQVNFKTEAKFPILHLALGKVSFGAKKLEDNIIAALTAVKIQNIKTITLKSTMSPGIKLDTSSIV